MDEIKDEIRLKFCAYLRRWADENWDKPKKRKDLAKLLGLKTPQQLTNTLSDPPRRCSDETWRRFAARQIGVSYETMIGLKPADHVAESPPPEYVNSKTAEVLRLTKEILESKTKWAVFMEKCIHEFHAAVIEQAQIEQPDKTDGGSTLAQKESMAPREKSGKTRRYS